VHLASQTIKLPRLQLVSACTSYAANMSEINAQQVILTDVPPSLTAESHKRKQVADPSENPDSGRGISSKKLLLQRLARKKVATETKELENPDEDYIEPDPVALDRKEVEQQLHSGASIFVLERTKSWRSYCRARFCIPREWRGRPTIESAYRLNLKDRTGERSGQMPHYLRKSPIFVNRIHNN
jgi:hypothetical protein